MGQYLKDKIGQKIKIVKDISTLTHMPVNDIYNILALYSHFFTDIYILTMLVKYGDKATEYLDKEIGNMKIIML